MTSVGALMEAPPGAAYGADFESWSKPKAPSMYRPPQRSNTDATFNYLKPGGRGHLVALPNVRYWVNSGRHLLNSSSSGFDPTTNIRPCRGSKLTKRDGVQAGIASIAFRSARSRSRRDAA